MVQKEKLINQIIGQLEIKIETIQRAIADTKESRDNETKSSVGDKYETGRAMTQMELEKSQAQLAQTENLKSSLLKINVNTKFDVVEFGSLVETSQGNYFFSIAFGKIELEGFQVFCLSPVSPIGQLLLGKKTGDKVLFQGKEIVIERIR